MPIVTSHYTVGTAAIQIVSPTGMPQDIYVHDHEHSNSSTVFLGSRSVGTANGMHIPEMETLRITLGPDDELWAVAEGQTSVLHVMKILQD